MIEILFLSHRVPYPPTKGDKIRSWHLLSGLARRATVHLGTFVDDPADWNDLEGLRAVCGEVCLRPLQITPDGSRIEQREPGGDSLLRHARPSENRQERVPAF